MSAIPQFVKRLEARIALALAQAKSALAGIASLSNHISQTNAASPAAAALVTFTSTPFVSRSGKVLVSGQILLGGGTMAAGDQVVSLLVRDGVAVPGFPGGYGYSVAGASGSAMAIGSALIDSVAPGSSHTWGIQASIPAGHTSTYAIGEALITVIELPG